MSSFVQTLHGLAGIPKSYLLEARRLSKTFGAGSAETHAVRDASCSFAAGELSLLMGPSGSGKTTFISMLAGLLRPSAGEVTLCGTALHGLHEEEVARLRRRHLGFVFQGYNLFPALSALDNVAEVLVLKGMRRTTARERAASVLQTVGLGQRLQHRPGELSGGQQQRVAIARALAGEPRVIVGDEVTAALDTASAQGVMELLRRQVTAHTAVVLVTHDARFLHHADRVVEMRDGQIAGDRTLAKMSRRGEMERA